MEPATDGLSCTSQVGSATVTGSVGGTPVKANYAAGLTVLSQGQTGFGVSFIQHPSGGTCYELSRTVTKADLGILLCSSSPGSYTIGTKCDPKDSGSLANMVTIPNPGAILYATDGTVTIQRLDPFCGGLVQGSFLVRFSGEKVSGSFTTVGCGTISVD
jgi:hypothetical protein